MDGLRWIGLRTVQQEEEEEKIKGGKHGDLEKMCQIDKGINFSQFFPSSSPSLYVVPAECIQRDGGRREMF